MIHASVSGWVELDGQRISHDELCAIVSGRPGLIRKLGGEFFLSYNGCSARDHLGIIPGNCPAGTIICNGVEQGRVSPEVPEMQLEEAIIKAVALRCDEGITALSGGVDSSLVARLAQRECISVGLAGSHDLRHAQSAAKAMGLCCSFVEISEREVEEALPLVVRVIPEKNPVNTGIALTQYFITRFAGEHGYRRVITGQGADELFGGYARYRKSENLEADLARDVSLLPAQAARDQSVAVLHRTFLSMPYLDVRVMRASCAIPACEKIRNGRMKVPLREVAERHIPKEIAWKEKKAMQYGSGIWDTLRRIARHNGFKTSLQGYIDHISRLEHGH